MHVNWILWRISENYAIIMNQFEFEYRRVFSSRFDKQDENDQVLDENELYFNFNNDKNLSESDIDNNTVSSQLEKQIQNQETRDKGRNFDRFISMTIYF